MDQSIPSQTPEPTLYIPPAPPSANPATATPKIKKSKKGILFGIIGGLILALGVGGYFAYSKGYISIPFISPKSDELFETMVDSISKIKNAQYSVRVNLKAEPRSGKATTIFIPKSTTPTTNTSSVNVNTRAETNTASDTSTATTFSIESVGSTIGLSEPDYGDSYLGGLMELAQFDEIFQSVPGDINFSGGVSLFVEADKVIKEANGFVRIDGTYKGGDISVDLDLEARKIGKDIYGIVNKFPSFFFVDPSAIKGKWIDLTSGEGNDWIDETVYEEFDTKQAIETIKLSLSNALKYKLFKLGRQLGTEMIAGVNSQHYTVTIDVDQFPALYDAIIAEKKKKNEETKEFQAVRDALDSPDVIATLKRIADNSTIDIWVDKVNGYLRQTKWSLTVVPPDGNEKLAGKQFVLEFVVTMDKVNQGVSVDKPNEVIDLDEATRLLSGISKEDQQFEKQRDRLSELQRALNAYITAAGKSPTSITEMWPKFSELDKECKARAEQRQVNANASTNAAYDYEKDYNCYSYSSYNAEGLSVIDVYTNKPYGYSKDGTTNYAVTYEMTLPTSDRYSYYADQYSAGKNTMTRTDMSIEKESPSDKVSTDDDPVVANTNKAITNTSINTNTSLNTNTTSPTPIDLYADTDGDGIADYTETATYRTDPNKADTDGDGFSDDEEVSVYKTSAITADTDGDGYKDKEEVYAGYNPLGPGTTTDSQSNTWGLNPTFSAPKIYNVTVTVSNNEATVYWKTTQPATGKLEYNETGTQRATAGESFVDSYSQVIPFPVTSGKTYTYYITACNTGKLCTVPSGRPFVTK